MKLPLISKQLGRLTVLVAAVALTCNLSAALLWNFNTTDGSTTIAGSLETDGSQSDLAGSALFNVLSISAILIDGVPVPFTDQLPLTDTSGSSFNWDGSSLALPLFINAFSADFEHQIEIDLNPGDPDEGLDPFFRAHVESVGSTLADFTPSSTTLTPVPVSVPEPAACGGALAAAALFMAFRRFRSTSARTTSATDWGIIRPS